MQLGFWKYIWLAGLLHTLAFLIAAVRKGPG
jgi:hypothetical protein